ncbi:MAG TPA: hypothetical protein VGU25_17470 [Acidobacteriaceae bacterium]|nr:hypothetical protein [Acidobacteriaceae bacterium]
MSLESVARLAELAATDSGVLSALQNDPSQIRKPLQLSDAQMRALISASSFTTDRPVRTTSQPEPAVGNAADLMELGTLGTLLPPEGSGAFPTPADLPPGPVTPKTVAPVHVSPRPQPAPQTPPRSGPVAPQHGGPIPVSPSPAPLSPSPQSSTPQGTPSVPRSSVTPGSSTQTPATPSSVTVPGSQQVSTATSSGTPQSASQPQVYTAMPTLFTQVPGLPMTLKPGGCCGCEVGMVALTAQLSATAQAALTAITAIAGLE